QRDKWLSLRHCHTKNSPHVYISFIYLLPIKTLNQCSDSKRHCPHSKSSSRACSPPNSKRQEPVTISIAKKPFKSLRLENIPVFPKLTVSMNIPGIYEQHCVFRKLDGSAKPTLPIPLPQVKYQFRQSRTEIQDFFVTDKGVLLETCGGEDLEGGETAESSPEISVRSESEVLVAVAEVIRGDGPGAVREGLVVVGEALFDGFWGREDKDGTASEF
ncbi:hypothetical protein HID58_089420, partial [Brassica napus]